MKVSRVTPVLFVDRVEPTRDFFRQVGFEVVVEIPEDDRAGFALMEKDGVQLMVETRGNANEPPEMRARVTRTHGSEAGGSGFVGSGTTRRLPPPPQPRARPSRLR